MPMTALTTAKAQALHTAAAERGTSPLWVVFTDPAQPGRVEACVYVETHAGGELPGVLAADTLDELRAMLPAKLTRREWTPTLGPDVVEMWD